MIYKGRESYWINCLRAASTVGVITLHVSAVCVLQEFESLKNCHHSEAWHVGNIVDSVSRFCVPVFVMISGGLLLGRQQSMISFYRNRINRILLPFVFWSLMYATYYYFDEKYYEIDHTTIGIIKYYLINFLKGAAFHLWFLYLILGLYLITPIISPWVRQAKNKELCIFIFIWLIATLSMQVGFQTRFGEFTLTYFNGYIGYYLLGYFLMHRLSGSKFITILSVAISFAGIGITAFGTYVSSIENLSFSSRWYEYLTINVIMVSSGVFLLAKKTNRAIERPNIRKVVDWVSERSFGIYLSHVLVLKWLSLLSIDYLLITPLLGIPITVVACLVGSCLLVYLIRQIPFGPHISG